MSFQQREYRKRLRSVSSQLYQSTDENQRTDRFEQVAVYKKSIAGPELETFLKDPDGAMEQGVMLKDGDSTTVVRLPLAGQDVVVKRYNIQNTGYLLRRLFRPSRAWYCWRNAHWLTELGLDTAAPLLMIERRWGRLRREAWFVTQWRDGDSLQSMIESQGGDSQDWQHVMSQVKQFLDRLHQSRFVHGDMKSSNILLDNGGLVILDLDSMRPEWWNASHKKYSQRDWKRFKANWADKSSMPATGFDSE